MEKLELYYINESYLPTVIPTDRYRGVAWGVKVSLSTANRVVHWWC